MITAESYFKKIDRPPARRRIRERPNVLEMPVNELSVWVEINYGRYIVNCPFCANAEFEWEDHLFFCSECNNKEVGGQLVTVLIPPQKKAIEVLLEKRPVENQNWKYPETVNDLAKENKEHGVE